MEYKDSSNRVIVDVFVKLNNSNLLRLPVKQDRREIVINPSECIDRKEDPDVTLICYKIHLTKENKDIFAYLFKNINPISKWYDKQIRDGDRLVALNGQDVSCDDLYSSIMKQQVPFTCQIVWHPELYMEFGENSLVFYLYGCSLNRKS